MNRRLLVPVLVLALGGVAVMARARHGPDRFDHAKHAKLFPSCTGCHAGATDSSRALLPDPASTCVACHDGTAERRVDWTPRPGPRPSNLAFVHATHPKVAECRTCHADAASPWMTVRSAQPATCFTCHGEKGTDHLAQADTLCVSCHAPLAGARPQLLAAMVAQFPRPPSHHADDFGAGGGHGRLAKAGDRSCATCHAREYCLQCHVDGDRTPAIARLGSDPRALSVPIAYRAPAS
ncbi:MAG TPA: cytochrome c3 family protein, partial [Gemmatimonadales bacterium]|nr:cytochrome c3 family protein [Gemmatimonadales bacterium]